METRQRLLAALDAHGTPALRAIIEPLIQPAIFIRSRALAPRPDHDGGNPDALDAALDELPLGASRFGGIPDLPPGTVWPSRDDVPMELVAQIRLADVAGLDPEQRLPASGSLAFFYNSQWLTSDQGDADRCAVVVFHAGPDDVLVRTAPPRVDYQGEYDSSPRIAPYLHGLASLHFESFECPPGGVGPFVTGELSGAWQDFDAYHSATYLPQADAENRLLGYIGGQDYVDAHRHGTADQLLLQVDSDDNAQFQWGDCDRLYFVLTKDELAARDFSKVRLYSMLG